MSQRQPQFQTGMGPEQRGGHQQWSGQQGGGQPMQQRFQGRLSPQQRGAITNVAQAIEVCSWCADQCIQEADPHMIECIRLCEDVAELGESTLALVSRNSRFGRSVAQSFQQAVQTCAQECGRHQHGHCQECAQVLSQVANSTQQLLQSPGQQPFQ